jgi:hypothetical protein
MKKIQLTQGQFALVDDEDYERLSKVRWHAWWTHHTQSFYARRNSPRVNGKRHLILMHREIMGEPDGVVVDHVNHNTLDNRRENLRACSHSENNHNQRKRCDNSSGFKGVSWNKRQKKWRAYIKINGKQQHLGYYTSEIEAAAAYDAAAAELHGDFALTNFREQQATPRAPLRIEAILGGRTVAEL